MNDSTLDRREFTRLSLLGMLSGVAITISSCGGGDGGPGAPTTPTTPPVTDKTGTISANHGHTAVIRTAELTAGGQLTLNIVGNATHPHTVELTAAEVVSIRDGRQVAKVSSTAEFHEHTVTFN